MQHRSRRYRKDACKNAKSKKVLGARMQSVNFHSVSRPLTGSCSLSAQVRQGDHLRLWRCFSEGVAGQVVPLSIKLESLQSDVGKDAPPRLSVCSTSVSVIGLVLLKIRRLILILPM